MHEGNHESLAGNGASVQNVYGAKKAAGNAWMEACAVAWCAKILTQCFEGVCAVEAREAGRCLRCLKGSGRGYAGYEECVRVGIRGRYELTVSIPEQDDICESSVLKRTNDGRNDVGHMRPFHSTSAPHGRSADASAALWLTDSDLYLDAPVTCAHSVERIRNSCRLGHPRQTETSTSTVCRIYNAVLHFNRLTRDV